MNKINRKNIYALSTVVLVCAIANWLNIHLLVRKKQNLPDLNRRKGDRIIGGKTATPKEFPFAAVVKVEQDGYVFTCGSSIISDKYLVTAAHCMFPSITPIVPSNILVGVGNIDIRSSKVLGIKKIMIHPKYQSLGSFNDIALLELNETLTLSDSVATIKVDMSAIKENDEMTAVGWGVTSNNETIASKLLMDANLYVKSSETCAKVRANFTSNNLDVLCLANGENGKDTCYGDSGAPVLSIYKDDNAGQDSSMDSKFSSGDNTYGLMGLTSYGDIIGNDNKNPHPDCGDPKGLGFYTRVAYYIYFIANVTEVPIKSLVLDRTLNEGIISHFDTATKAIEIEDAV